MKFGMIIIFIFSFGSLSVRATGEEVVGYDKAATSFNHEVLNDNLRHYGVRHKNNTRNRPRKMLKNGNDVLMETLVPAGIFGVFATYAIGRRFLAAEEAYVAPNIEPTVPKGCYRLNDPNLDKDDLSFGSISFYNLKYIQDLMHAKSGAVDPGKSASFNVIFRYPEVQNAKKIAKFVNIEKIMQNPLNQEAFIQVAANDNPARLGEGGQAGAILDVTGAATKYRYSFSPIRSLCTRFSYPADIDNILIGEHLSVPVDGSVNQKQRVSLVFVAAKQGSYNCIKTQNCLRVAYEGTLLTAAQHNSEKVFLTIMGGEIFKNANPTDEVTSAIKSAVDKYVKKYALNIVFVCWLPNNDTERVLLESELSALSKTYGGYVCKFGETSSLKDGKVADLIEKFPGDNKDGKVTDITNASEDDISDMLFNFSKKS